MFWRHRSIIDCMLPLLLLAFLQSGRAQTTTIEFKYIEGRIDPNGILGIASNGTLYRWGDGRYQEGKAIVAPKLYQKGIWGQVLDGYTFICALPLGGGKPQCWNTGKESSSVVSGAPKITSKLLRLFNVGDDQICGEKEDGKVECWGASFKDSPLSTDKDWSFLCSNTHTCGLKKDGSLYCWGDNENNQVSPDKTNVVKKPYKIPGTWKAVTCGSGSTIAIDTANQAKGWGRNEFVAFDLARGGSLGTGKPMCYNPKKEKFCDVKITDAYVAVENKPIAVSGNIKWESISAGMAIVCGIEAGTRKGYCWGYTTGEAFTEGSPQTNAPKLIDNSTWAVLEVGAYHSCGIKTDGSLWCWGGNPYNCEEECPVGDGTMKIRARPTKVIGVSNWLPPRFAP